MASGALLVMLPAAAAGSGAEAGAASTAGQVTVFHGTGFPSAMTRGPDGAMWFTDPSHDLSADHAGTNRIGRITTAGKITTYPDPRINRPAGITAGPDDALWFTNQGSNTIGRITTAGKVTRYTGTGISSPTSIAVGPDRTTLWFTNQGNNSIGRITMTGAVTNFTGTGISSPTSITVGKDEALWFTNHGNNTIGRITIGGKVTSYPASGAGGPFGITAGRDGALWFTSDVYPGSIGRITTGGKVTTYTDEWNIVNPAAITAGPDGALWFANRGDGIDSEWYGDGTIGRITTAGTVTGFYEHGIMAYDVGIASGPDGALWFTNQASNVIGRVTTTGTFSHYGASIYTPAGIAQGPDGSLWFANDGGFGVNGFAASIGRITAAGGVSSFSIPEITSPRPSRITTGPDGAMWFANTEVYGPGSLGRITTGGALKLYYDPGIVEPTGIAVGADGALWFTNPGVYPDYVGSIGRITTAGKVTNYSAPGLNGASAIVAGPDGALWFTNHSTYPDYASSIGRITTAGRITIFKNSGIQSPADIAPGRDGALWFTNPGNNTIGRITTSGKVTTYADPSISNPNEIAAGADGALWFTNRGNHSIGRITTTGKITNYTGTGISDPYGITAGPDGAMWFTNAYTNESIGRITTAVTVKSPAVTSGPSPTLKLGSQVGSTPSSPALPVTVAWPVTPGSSPVCSTLLQRSVIGSPWATVPVPNPSATSTTDTLPATGDHYQYRVSITDCDGGTTGWVAGQPFGYSLLQESSSQWQYTPGTAWRPATCAQCSGGSARYATAKNATATLTLFSASDVGLVMRTGPTQGSANVSVDGKLSVVNTYAPTAGYRLVVFKVGWATFGPHTVRVTNLATTGHPRIDIDAAAVRYGP